MFTKEAKQFFKYLFKYWNLMMTIVLIGFVNIPLSLFPPYCAKIIIDKIYVVKDIRSFLILALTGTGVFVLSTFLANFGMYLTRRLNRMINFDITRDLFRHLQALPLNFYSEHSTGEFVYRVSNDTKMISDFLSSNITKAVFLTARFLGLLALVFYLNWKVGFLTVCLVPATFLSSHLFGKWIREVTKKQLFLMQNIFKQLQEFFSHIHLVKSVGKGAKEIELFEKNFAGAVDQELRTALVAQVGAFSTTVLNNAIGGLIILYGGYLVLKGSMTLGTLIAISLYLMQAVNLLKSFGLWYQDFSVNAVARHRVAEMLAVKPVAFNCKDSVKLSIAHGIIEFRDVWFGYRKGQPVLQGINFAMSAGKRIVLSGPSGVGKTTIFSLILRTSEPDSGAILIDGLDVRLIQPDSFYAQFGAALQESFLWNDTVAYNILYGNQTASEKEMVAAARIAEADGFIKNLPHGYDTMIGEMANTLSEGQKQRLALARALVKKPKILLLDEALSSLDSGAENKIMENISEALPHSTILTISHRASIASKADRVYFLESGVSVQEGSYEELIAKNHRFRELFNNQI